MSTVISAGLGAPLAVATATPTGRFDGVPRAGDVVIAGEAVPRLPGPRYQVWDLPRPPGGVRAVRDDIDRRVEALLNPLVTAESGVTA